MDFIKSILLKLPSILETDCIVNFSYILGLHE